MLDFDIEVRYVYQNDKINMLINYGFNLATTN